MAVEHVLNSTAKEASEIPQSTPVRDDGSATSGETGKGSMAEVEKVYRFHLCVKLSGSIYMTRVSLRSLEDVCVQSEYLHWLNRRHGQTGDMAASH